MTQLGFSGPRETFSRARIGRFQSGNPQTRAATSARPSVAKTPQVYTIASGSPSNDTTYSMRVVEDAFGIDETVSITTDGTATAAEVESAFATAWAANPALAGIGTPVASTDLVITMIDSVDVVITETSAASVLTITETTAPSDSPSYPFGRWVSLAPSTASGLAGFTFAGISEPTHAALTLTITHDSSYTYILSAEANGPRGDNDSQVVTWASGANADATDDNAVAALEAAFAGTGWVVTNPSTGTVVLTAPLGWSVGWLNASASGSGSGDLAAATTDPGAIGQIGWMEDPQNEDPASVGAGVTSVSAGRPALIVTSAPTSVVGVEASGATPTAGGIVYIETASGANNGRPYTVQSSTGSRYPHPTAQWFGVDPVLSTVHTIQL